MNAPISRAVLDDRPAQPIVQAVRLGGGLR